MYSGTEPFLAKAGGESAADKDDPTTLLEVCFSHTPANDGLSLPHALALSLSHSLTLPLQGVSAVRKDPALWEKIAARRQRNKASDSLLKERETERGRREQEERRKSLLRAK
jgi:hypothetical protein